MRPLIPLLWTCVGVCPEFPCLYVSVSVRNVFFIFTSGVTPADLFVAGITAKLFSPIYLQMCTGIAGQPWLGNYWVSNYLCEIRNFVQRLIYSVWIWELGSYTAELPTYIGSGIGKLNGTFCKPFCPYIICA